MEIPTMTLSIVFPILKEIAQRDGNWKTVRKICLGFLDYLQDIQHCKRKETLTRLLHRERLAQLSVLPISQWKEYSFLCNALFIIHKEGYHKDFVTFFTDEPSLHKVGGKKYPNL